MNKYLISVLFVLLILIGGASAATIDLPTIVTQGDSFAVNLDCPEINGWPGDASDECLITWTGPETGSFTDNDGDPDPDTANQYLTLDLPGIYDFNIYECTTPGNCETTPSGTDSINVSTAPNQESIWAAYRSRKAGAWAPKLYVSGYAPIGTNKVQIYVRDENNAGVVSPLSMELATYDPITRYYRQKFDLLDVYNSNPQILNVQAVFKDSNQESARIIVEALLADYHDSQIADLEQETSDLYLKITDLNNDINNLQNQINDLNAQDSNFAAQIAVINQKLADHDQNIIDLQNNLNALNQRVTDLNSELHIEITRLDVRIDDVNNRLTTLKNKVERMNHGTVWILFDYDNLNGMLRVKGEYPEGTATINIYVKDINKVTQTIYPLTAGEMDTTQNSYGHNYANVNDWNKDLYDIAVEFLDSGNNPIGQQVNTRFDLLKIIDMDNRLTTLEQIVDNINDSTLQSKYDSVNDKLTIFGEARTETVCAQVYLYTVDGTALEMSQVTVAQNMGDDYNTEFVKDSNWPNDIMVGYAEFFSDTNCSVMVDKKMNSIDSVLAEDLYGFRNIIINSLITTYYVNDIKVPINYGLKPVQKGQYKMEYRMNSGAWTQLKSCQWYSQGVVNSRNGLIDFDNTTVGQVNQIKLRAKKCSGTVETYYTPTIRVKHVDLKDALTASTTIVSPDKNNSVMNLNYPYGSIADQVFWTQSGPVSLVSYFTTNTRPDRNQCEIEYYITASGSDNINKPSKYDIKVDGNKWVCDTSGQLFTSQWDEINNTDGKYSRILVYNDVEGHSDSHDEIRIGIDNNEPMIGKITPTQDINMAGIYRWTADINDNLSGIKEVEFQLIEKIGVEYCHPDVNCHIADENTPIRWSVFYSDANVGFATSGIDTNKFYYDLNTLEHADGDYNVAFVAWDVAGNGGMGTAYLEIDPIIDNTSPAITINSITTPVRRAIDSINISVDVNDNFGPKYSGVDKVWATITNTTDPLDTNMIYLTKDGNYYVGTFVTDINFDLNNYTVTIDANDKVGNNAISNDQNVLVIKNYYFNITTTASGTATYNFQADGNFRDDLRNVPDSNADSNTILVTVKGVLDGNVQFDANGLYTIKTSSLGEGTHIIDLNYNTNDYNYTDQITITVTAAPVYTGGGPGGGGGITRDVCGNNICSSTETCETCPDDCGECDVVPEEIVPQEPVLLPTPRDVLPVVPTEPSGADLVIETAPTTPAEEPQGPTGFFGLGEVTDLGVGIIGILAIIAIIAVVWKSKK